MDLPTEQRLPVQGTKSPHDNHQAQTGRSYILPSSKEERTRLIQQQSLLLKSTGGKLVHAPVTLNEECSVLETATGAGIWLQDLAKTVPATTELIGTDINPSFFPDPSTLPQNLRFQTQSVLDLPNEWTNKFDLVHQRLLLLGLRGADWRTAIGEIYRVLKPGGWFQLFEIERWEQSGPNLIEFERLFTSLFEIRDMRGFWPNGSVKWREYIEEVGFVDVRVTWHDTPLGKWAGQEGIHGKDNQLGVIRGIKKVVTGFGLVNGDEEYDKLVEELERELDDSRAETRSRFVMICAQKPPQH